VRTRVGANLRDLLANEIEGDARIVSGSPLSGRAIDSHTDYLGRYDTQITLLREHSPPDGEVNATGSTSLHGWPSGMLSIEAFERVWPFEAPPIPLLRALLAQDIDTAQALGCLGFEEEDLALCSYLCPAKYDYGRALRATLDVLRSEQ
jgi:Na+-transporting NADH:ubiquinone oxidoreductase subunit A